MPNLKPVPSPGEETRRLRTGVHPSYWFTAFNAFRLLECIVELLKNGFDWNSNFINIVTNETRNQFRIIDDGRGMNEANRNAFVSVGMSTAGGNQSGTFGTGAKKIVFTFSSHVSVVTAPEDDPNYVWIFDFTPEQLAEAYSGLATIESRRVLKTKKNWPHEHDFGTDITFTLKKPNSKSVHRGYALADKLSHRLNNVYVSNGMVLVDGEQLPAKQIIGELYRLEMPAALNPMGGVMLEFYHPANLSSDDGLMMTDRAIGEVLFSSFYTLLTPDQQQMVPWLLRQKEVCGLIKADFLNKYVTERRDSYDGSVADEERVFELLRLLMREEANIAEKLGIKLPRTGQEDPQGQEEILSLVERLNRTWEPSPDAPVSFTPGEFPARSRNRGHDPQPPSPMLPRMYGPEEVELGEVFAVKLTVPGRDRTSEGFVFYCGGSNAEVVEQKSGEVTLRANQLGRALVSATNPQTGEQARVEYEVVDERIFKLSTTFHGVDVGSKFTVR
jgi:hypothetical protein